MLGKRDKDTSSPTDIQPSSSSNVADSAYASSENEPKTSNVKSSDVVSFENTGQISGVNKDRPLTLNKNTGDVQDEDTGEVVSTVTTT